MNKITIICAIVIISAVAVPYVAEAREFRPHSASKDLQNLQNIQNLQNLQNNIPVIGRITKYLSDKLIEHLRSVRSSVATGSANGDIVDVIDHTIENVQGLTSGITKLIQAEEIYQSRPQGIGF